MRHLCHITARHQQGMLDAEALRLSSVAGPALEDWARAVASKALRPSAMADEPGVEFTWVVKVGIVARLKPPPENRR